MFLGGYRSDREPIVRLAGYDGLMAGFPTDASLLYPCVRRGDGISLFDGCPSRAVFEGFKTGGDFGAACAAVGLPEPRIEHVGDAHVALLRDPVLS
jgi:hypothetical protein